MKGIHFLLIILTGLGLASCNEGSLGSETDDTTVNRIIPPASDNSQATNPSLADTAYPKKDTMITRGDSARANKK